MGGRGAVRVGTRGAATDPCPVPGVPGKFPSRNGLLAVEVGAGL